MYKCNCFRSGTEDGQRGGRDFCVGTREKDWCTCNGDESKCNFYDYIRERGKRNNRVDEVIANDSIVPFQWNSMDVSPNVNSEVEHLDILVCYIDNGEVLYKSFKYFDKYTRDTDLIRDKAVAWCYIKQPDNALNKEEAVEKLHDLGILDQNGNIYPIYREILSRVASNG